MDKVIDRPLHEIVDEDKDNREEFVELLNSAKINPHAFWEAQRDAMAADPRYLALSTNADRKQAFEEWKQAQIDKLSTINTSESFLRFVHSKFTPGMLYAMFKRKFRKDPGFADSPISEKEKETLFQEYKMVFQIENKQEQVEYIRSHPLFSMLQPQP